MKTNRIVRLRYEAWVCDGLGVYPVHKASFLATAPRRKNGFWDKRTKLGLKAIEIWNTNQDERFKQYKETGSEYGARLNGTKKLRR